MFEFSLEFVLGLCKKGVDFCSSVKAGRHY